VEHEWKSDLSKECKHDIGRLIPVGRKRGREGRQREEKKERGRKKGRKGGEMEGKRERFHNFN
jgi:hypothetical protein